MSSCLFKLTKFFTCFAQFFVQELIGFLKVVPLQGQRVKITLEFLKLADAFICLIDFLSSFFVSMIVVSSQYTDLLEEDLVFFCQQVSTIFQFHYFINGAYSLITAILVFSVVSLGDLCMISIIFNNSEILPLLNLQLISQFFILSYNLLTVFHLSSKLKFCLFQFSLQQSN